MKKRELSDRLDPDGYDLGDYRYAVAKVIKLLIRARAKAEPDFLSGTEYVAWRLSDIHDDRTDAQTLLKLAQVATRELWQKYIGPNGSGGVRGDDPHGELKEAVVQFTMYGAYCELEPDMGQIDWKNVANWSALPRIRAGLDALPHPSHVDPACPVEIGDPKTRDVLVRGKVKRLTAGQFNVIETIVTHFPHKLTGDQLVKASGHRDAVNMLKKIAKTDDDWDDVIHLAGSNGGGYGISTSLK